MNTITKGRWLFVGLDGSKGFRKGKVYNLEVRVNNDPDDFFIHINPHTSFLGLRSLKLDDTFYDSPEAFNENWVSTLKENV